MDPLDLAQQLASAARALEAVRAEGLEHLSDAGLVQLVAASARNERISRAHSALLAGEVARRSAPELGHNGLAQRSGHRTPQKLIQATTGVSSREAAHAVRVGGLAKTHPWLDTVARAVAEQRVSTEAADSIRAGLGMPSDDVPASVLAAAAERLLAECPALDADRVFLVARDARDELDAVGIVDRERAARQARELRVQRMRDGSVRVVWHLDPIEGSVVSELYDRATSPRRGGPRFVSTGRGSSTGPGSDAERAQRVIDDPRSTEQLASDVFFELLTAGAERKPDQLLGQGAPAVRVTITEKQLIARTGHGRLQRTQQPVSIETVERLACVQGTVSVLFDEHGQPLDVGREHRLFTPRQRTALAERDGGCRWTGCDRPPSWCEAHHVEHWARDGGRTDVADGLLLCKHHHLLLHDHHWEIERRGPARSEYWLIPPPDHPDPHPRLLVSTSLALRDLLAG
jgi:hypothetical protein